LNLFGFVYFLTILNYCTKMLILSKVNFYTWIRTWIRIQNLHPDQATQRIPVLIQILTLEKGENPDFTPRS